MEPQGPLEQLFLDHLPTIDGIVDFVARRNRLRPEEKEEFRSEVRCRLIEDDYGILRRHSGASSFEGYLRACIQNLWTTHLRTEEGRFRPSAEAGRLGPLAQELETLLVRERRSLTEACDRLIAQHPGVERRDLEELAVRLPLRIWRKVVGEEEIAALPTPARDALDRLVDRELIVHKVRALAVMREGLAALSDDERQLVLLRAQGVQISQIARSLGIDSRGLYRQRQKVLDQLRRQLEKEGLRWQLLQETLGVDLPEG